MTTAIIITLCILLLIAYVFDVSSSKTRIPSVVLLLVLGWISRQAATVMDIELPDLNPILPVLGTIGLILIVMEGSIELKLDKSKRMIIAKSSLVALIPMVALAFALAYGFHYVGGYDLKKCLISAIPLCIISSAVAIPSVKNLKKTDQEFIIYESSLSDIIGVLFFNFFIYNEIINAHSIGMFSLQIVAVIVISIIATLGLAFLLSRIHHPIKFTPIILLVILIYAIGKIYHLPGLIFILLFGMSLGNLNTLKKFKWVNKTQLDALNHEVHKLHDLVLEAAFVIRAMFFLLFGFLIETSEILNMDTLFWALAIVGCIFVIRALQLLITRLPLNPLLFIAPRGLITILLFFTITPEDSIALVNKSLIIQVILLTAIVMMIGMFFAPKHEEIPTIEEDIEPEDEESGLSQEPEIDIDEDISPTETGVV